MCMQASNAAAARHSEGKPWDLVSISHPVCMDEGMLCAALRYLTQLLADTVKAGAPARIVWVSSLSETSTPDIDFTNLE